MVEGCKKGGHLVLLDLLLLGLVEMKKGGERRLVFVRWWSFGGEEARQLSSC